MKKHFWAKIALVCAIIVVLLIGGLCVYYQTWKAQDYGTAKYQSFCGQIGPDWAFYKAKNAHLSFCYNTAWGKPVEEETTVDKENRIGTEYFITFDKLGGTLAAAAPMISIETKDYKLTGGTGYPSFSWTTDFTLPQADLYKAMSLKNIKATLEKRFVNGKISLRVTKNYYDAAYDYQVDQIANYIKAKKYNLQISAGSKYKIDLETMVSSVRF
jgi:hypothetical protein